jgi:NAD(P)-dependent dehydrogenase (short-subunit alcohol dehydrogenase family)
MNVLKNNIMSSEQKRIALVTGANTGVGFQIVKALAENNYTVFIGARNIEKGKAAASELGANSIAIELDVTKQNTIDAAAATVKERFGKLDLLVNNAAISRIATGDADINDILNSQKASVADIDEVKAVWNTNVFGVITVTQAFLPLLHLAPAPRIVNVTSGMGSLTYNMNPSNPWRKSYGVVYAASKAAMNAITVSFAIELEDTNIKVNAVSPGFTATALNNFQGTDTVEVGSMEPVRVALDDKSGLTGQFTGPNQEIFPW